MEKTKSTKNLRKCKRQRKRKKNKKSYRSGTGNVISATKPINTRSLINVRDVKNTHA